MSTEGNNDLEAMLDDDLTITEAPAVDEPPAEPEPPEASEQSGEIDAAPPAEQRDDDGPMVPRRALEDERRKRQDYEKQVHEFQQWMQSQGPQQQQPYEQPSAPDVWTDPEGALRHQHQTLQSQFEQQIIATRVETSRHLMRMQHEDYDELEAVFDQACQQQPHLLHQAAQHPFPAQFAYQQARQFLVMEHLQNNPDAYASLMSGRGQDQPAIQQSRQPSAPVPRSLASKTSNAPRASNGQFVERASIDDLLDG